jgi:hypothetical protein
VREPIRHIPLKTPSQDTLLRPIHEGGLDPQAELSAQIHGSIGRAYELRTTIRIPGVIIAVHTQPEPRRADCVG